MPKRIAILVLVSTVAAVALMAGQTKKIVVGDFSGFQAGTLEGTAVDSRGRLFIGPRLSRVDGPDQEYYLSLVTAPDGSMLLGTGHGARVFRIPAGQGKTEKIFESEQLDVYGLLALPGGIVYVATSPNGSVFRVDAKKEVKKIFTPREKFIWALTADSKGEVYCAVGNPGGVYHIPGKGDPEKLLDADDAHITSLYAARSGDLYAGSADRGILYRISGSKVRVVFDSPFEEIRGICEDDKGNIFFAANRQVRHKARSAETPAEGDPRGSREKSEKAEKGHPAEKSALYRLRADGSVGKIWGSPDETIYDLFHRAEGKAVYVATGDRGRLYRVTPDGEYALIMEAPAAQIYGLAATRGGLLAFTNNTAGIWRIEEAVAGKGEYLSQVFDLDVPSRFGRISWRMESESGGGVAAVFVRTGNSRIPDSTWTPWTPPFTDPANARLDVRGYRYIQFKVALNSVNLARSPRFTRLTAYYLQNNLKPRVLGVKIMRVKAREAEGKDEKSTGRPGDLKVAWQAEDPNGDRLQAKLELRRVDSAEWMEYRDRLEGDHTVLDPRMMADGEYQLRITVNDGLSNPGDSALSADYVSPIFTVDSTAPALESLQTSAGILTFRVVDDTSVVADVDYSTDGEHWLPLGPDDGLNDSRVESFRLPLSRVRGSHLIYIRFRDEAGNFKIRQHKI